MGLKQSCAIREFARVFKDMWLAFFGANWVVMRFFFVACDNLPQGYTGWTTHAVARADSLVILMHGNKRIELNNSIVLACTC